MRKSEPKGEEKHIMATKAPERGQEDMLKEKITLRKRGQFTLPKNMMDELNLKEGDAFDAILEDGKIVLVPLVEIPADQAWFWTEEWQADEREVEQHIREGIISKEMDLDDVMGHLDKLMSDSE
jgi:AbrB family looped-hinge helix DNA binding protein